MSNGGDFSAELTNKTKDVHDSSDKLVRLKLAAVLTDTKLWAEAIAEFHAVFQAIEDALVLNKDHAHIGPLLTAVYDAFRTKPFEQDLQYYLGDDWKSHVKVSECAVNYCNRIASVAAEEPILLIAYVHTMYLAVLAGGQIIKRIVKKTLGLSGEEGLSLFEFGAAADRTELRRNIKAVINGLQLSDAQKEAILAEKNRIFRMNNAIANNIKTGWANYGRIGMFALLVVVVPSVLGVLFWYKFGTGRSEQ